MFEDIFATYNKVSPPETDPNFFNVQELEVEDFNPVAKQYNNQINYQQEEPKIESKTKDKKNKKLVESKKKSNLTYTKPMKGQDTFEKAFEQAASENPELRKHKDFFIKLCKHEGGFNPGIQNSAGAPYYGYFGFGQAALKQTSNYTMDQFRNDPVEQIRAAGKLYNQHIQSAKRLGFYDKAKQMGYSDDAIVAGAWLGGAGGVRNFILNNRDASDSHWYGGKGGTSISKRMKAFI